MKALEELVNGHASRFLSPLILWSSFNFGT